MMIVNAMKTEKSAKKKNQLRMRAMKTKEEMKMKEGMRMTKTLNLKKNKMHLRNTNQF